MLKFYKFPDKILVGSTERVDQVKQALQEVGRSRFARSSDVPQSSSTVAAGAAGY
jgi:hypothetical protein